jgi:hypothetical protein
MSLPADPREPYVAVAEVAAALGVDPADTDGRVARAVDTAGQIIDSYYGAATVAARLPAPPWPAPVIEAALVIAQDVWRRRSTPGGYFQVVDFVGRLSLDPANSVAMLLDSIGREVWPVA